MSLLNVESYVFINVFYLVLFCIHVCVDDDVIKKKWYPFVSKVKCILENLETLFGTIGTCANGCFQQLLQNFLGVMKSSL